MKAFTFVRPTSIEEAATSLAVKGSLLKAGGIDLLDRMKERVDEPDRVVFVGELGDEFRRIRFELHPPDTGSLWLGAGATLEEIAASSEVRKHCPALAEAAGLAASPQIRHRATLAGNLLQHTRCGYYRHRSFPCFKRGDEKCPVLEPGAVQDTAAIYGNSSCASAHPSSLAPVLAAYSARAVFQIAGTEANADMEKDFYGPPRRGVATDALIPASSVITAIRIPVYFNWPAVSAYEEVRQKSAFDWALASCCVRLNKSGSGVKQGDGAAIWLGSVAPTPWHAESAEKALAGKPLTDDTIRAAADAAVAGATPLPGNAYKVDLVKVVVRRALERLRAMK